MLHPTELPDCSPVLDRVLDFQEHLLEWACNNIVTPQTICTKLGVAFTWLTHNNDRRKLFQPIYDFARLPRPEKQEILAAFRQHRDYWQHIEEGAFRFASTSITGQQFPDFIKSWLVAFYDQFAKTAGLDGSLVGDPIGRQTWLRSYQTKNSGHITCAICDGSMGATPTVEHFLPKSQYPALALHPHNLIPLCSTCNNLKDREDPLKNGDLTTTFLPYVPNRSIRLAARLEFTQENSGRVSVNLVANTQSAQTDQQLATLQRISKLTTRWQGSLNEISIIAYRRLQDRIDALRDEGIEFRKDELSGKIDRVVSTMERNWGKEHYLYPATEWLKWAKTTKLEALGTSLEARSDWQPHAFARAEPSSHVNNPAPSHPSSGV